MYKVSYLIALFNKEEFIIDAINSILREESETVSIEICIVDDGSTDNSLKIVKNEFDEDNRVLIHSFDRNKGKNAAYNEAYMISSGDYISIFGADDLVIKGRTSLLLNESVKANKTIYGGYIIYDNEAKINLREVSPFYTSTKDILLQHHLAGGCFIAARENISNIFPIPEDLKFEDWWFAFHFVRHGLVKTLNIPVTIYRIHKNNDIGVIDIDFDAIKNDNLRRYDYLRKFKPYLNSDIEFAYWERALAVLDSFFGNKRYDNLLNRPFGRSWLKVLLYSLFGAYKIHRIREISKDCLKKILLKSKKIKVVESK
jgi:glycosyltransferase involved in cell wall biosynthesis